MVPMAMLPRGRRRPIRHRRLLEHARPPKRPASTARVRVAWTAPPTLSRACRRGASRWEARRRLSPLRFQRDRRGAAVSVVPLLAVAAGVRRLVGFLSRPMDVRAVSPGLRPRAEEPRARRSHAGHRPRRGPGRTPLGLPPVLDYRAHAEARSVAAHAARFAAYVVSSRSAGSRTRSGGLRGWGSQRKKAGSSRRTGGARSTGRRGTGVRLGHERDLPLPDRRSWTLPSSPGRASRLLGIEGHRSRGGLRVSLYNGVTLDDARAMATFLASSRG